MFLLISSPVAYMLYIVHVRTREANQTPGSEKGWPLLYMQFLHFRFLNISQRVHLMNEKLNYCAHMVELLKTDLHERRSLRLEVLIVLLISIEVWDALDA